MMIDRGDWNERLSGKKNDDGKKKDLLQRVTFWKGLGTVMACE